VRCRHTKHWNPKWKKERRAKVIHIKLPDFHEKITEDNARAKMKERGIVPQRHWMEMPIYVSCTGGIFEEYVPPEGDGKFSALTTTGVKQKAEFVNKKGRSYMAIRKIKSYEEDFNVSQFPEEAQEIYIKAHEALVNKDEDALRTFVTERAYPQMRHNSIDKTIHWRFLESLELPRVVQVKSTKLITEDNYFAQVTVRFHTQQTLAIYDRFGRLMSGSEILKKDVLEYVVFEKHISYEYGAWRIHGKIIPTWAPPREYGSRTYVNPVEKPAETKEDKEAAVSTVAPSTVADKDLPEVKAKPLA